MSQQNIHILILLLLIIIMVTIISAWPLFIPSANYYDCFASPSLNGYSTLCGYNQKFENWMDYFGRKLFDLNIFFALTMTQMKNFHRNMAMKQQFNMCYFDQINCF